MKKFFCVVFMGIFVNVMSYPVPSKKSCNDSYSFPFVTREEWGARPPLSVATLITPVPYVVIHHTYIPPACTTREACERSMRAMQDMHQFTNNWNDIGYNFAVGGDGSVYEGRGWKAVGAHSTTYNVKSIGIVLIGDFVENTPPEYQMQLAQELIAIGIKLGHISQDYQLIGHRQVSATECPGQALFDKISTWDRFVAAL